MSRRVRGALSEKGTAELSRSGRAWAWVPECGKRGHYARASAKAHARELRSKGDAVREYLHKVEYGGCGLWHVGHLPHEVRDGQISYEDFYDERNQWLEIAVGTVTFLHDHGHLPTTRPDVSAEEMNLALWLNIQRSAYGEDRLRGDRTAWLDDYLPGWRPIKRRRHPHLTLVSTSPDAPLDIEQVAA